MGPPVVVVAGGRGRGLSPLSQFLPKALAFLGAKPILHHVVDSLASLSPERILVALGPFSEMVEGYVVHSELRKRRITFIEPLPYGTGAALLALRDQLGSRFLVHYGDVVVKDRAFFPRLVSKHAWFHETHGAIGTLSYVTDYRLHVGLVDIDHSTKLVAEVKEKPIAPFNVNFPVAVFEQGVLDYVRIGDDLYADVVPRLIASGERLGAVENSYGWVHIQTLADLYTEHVESYREWLNR